MADIDNLSFSVVLKDEDFKKKLSSLETRAKEFNAIMEKALRVQAQTAAAEASSAKAAERRAVAEAEVARYTEAALMSKEKAGTISATELRVLNKVRTVQKALIGVDQERLSVHTRDLIAVMQEGQFTEIQLKSLGSLLTLDKARLSYADKQAKAAAKAAKEEEKQQAAAEGTTSAYARQSAVMSQLKTLIGGYVSILGGARLLGSIVRITGEFEAQRVALGAILGEVAEANILFDKLKVLAVKSPYTFAELTSYSKQLAAFSEPTEQLYETTKMLSDVSAGLGVDMSRIVLAWGQVRSAAYLRGQELRQFTEAGIPMLQQLAEQFAELEGRAVSTGEVFEKISTRQVPFEMVAEAFERMTSAGGKFYNMQEVLAGTVKGKVANLADAWQIMLSTIGNSNNGLISGVLDALRFLIEHLNNLDIVLKGAALSWVAYKVAVLAADAATGKSIGTLKKLVKVMNVIKAHPVILALSIAAGAILGITQYLKRLNEEANKHLKIVYDTTAAASAQLDVMESYLQILKRTAVGTEDYERTRKELVKYAGNYLSALDKERLVVGDLAGVYDNLKVAVEGAARARGMEQAYAQIDQDATAKLEKIYDHIGKVSPAFLLKFKAYAQGVLSYEDLVAGESLNKLVSLYATAWNTAGLKRENLEGNAKHYLEEYAAQVNAVKQEVLTKRREVEQAFNDIYGASSDEKLGQIIAKVTKEQWGEEFLPKPTELFGEWVKRMQEYSKEAKEVVQLTRLPKVDLKKGAFLAEKQRKKGEIADILLEMFGISEDANLNEDQKLINRFIKEKAAGYGKILVSSLKATESTTMVQWREQAKDMYDASKATLDSMTKAMAQQEGETIEAWRKRMNGNIYSIAEGRIRFIEDLWQALYGTSIVGTVEEKNKTPKGGLRDAIADVKQQVEDLKLLKKYYDEMAALGFNDKEIRFFFGSMGLTLPEEGLDAAFKALSNRLKALGDKNGAQDVLNYLAGRDMDASIKSLKESRNALEAWGKQVDALQAKAKRLGLDGFSLELDKILVDTDSKNRQLLAEWSQKEKDLEEAKDGWIEAYRIKHEEATIEEATKAWEEYYQGQRSLAKEHIDEMVAYNNKVAQKQINDKASGWVTEMLGKKGIDLGNVDNKSLAQLERYLFEMEQLASSKALEELIPDTLKEDAKAVSVSFETLLDAIREILGNKMLDVKADALKKKFDAISQSLKNVGVDVDFSAVTEQLNRLNAAEQAVEKNEEDIAAAKKGLFAAGSGALIGGVASALSKAAEGMKEWAEATGDTQLQKQAEGFEMVSAALQGVANGITTAAMIGGPLGIAMGAATGLLSIVSAVFNKIVETRKVNYEIAQSTKQLVEDYKQLNYQLKEFNETFGNFSLDKATDAMDKYDRALISLQSKLSLFSDYTRKRLRGFNNEQLLELGKYVNALDMVLVQTSKKGFQGLKAFLEENNIDLYGENGILDTDDIGRLETVIDNLGDRVSDSDKQLMNAILNTLKAMKEAEDELNSTVSDYLGSLSETMVDALWTEFTDGGESAWEAWTDEGKDAIGEVAKAMLRAKIQEAWLNKYLEPLQSAFADQDIARIASLIQAMTNDIDAYKQGQSWLNELDAKLKEQGIDLFAAATDADGTLSSGIKSITEDTANLLASYLNGIRADVSYGRVLWERMAVALEGMGSQDNTPSLAEYLPKIEAHTANIAATNQQLLSSLQSVITREGGLPAIRSYR